MISVLPDSSCGHPHSEYASLSPPGAPPYGSRTPTHPSGATGLTELEPILTPRYAPPDPNNGYVNYSNSWSSNGYNTYNNFQYNNLPMNNNTNLNCAQQTPYISPPAPTMVLYPHLYSTVNQNQIHLHLHGSTDKLDQYFSGESPLTISSATSVKGSIEIGLGGSAMQPLSLGGPESESGMVQSDNESAHHSRGALMPVSNVNTDPSSVWRPY